MNSTDQITLQELAELSASLRENRRLTVIMEDEVKRVFDRPVGFSVRAFGTTPATKESLESVLFIKDRQAKYLLPNIVGGLRGQKGFEKRLASDTGTNAYWVPGEGIKLTVAGNLSPAQIAAIAARIRASGRFGEVFVGKPNDHLPFGIWGRIKQGRGVRRGHIKPLLIRVRQPSYKPRFDFYGLAKRRAQTIFNEEFDKAFDSAVRSIRPVSKARL